MNALVEEGLASSTAQAALQAAAAACGRIAPTWPLDQFIAVNPYWEWVGKPIESCAAALESCAGSRMVMPRSFYRDQWRSGGLRKQDLEEALERTRAGLTLAELLDELEREPPVAPRIPLMTAIADAERDLLHGLSVTDFVTHNLSQHCASYFDYSQSSWEAQHKESLYQSWLHHARADRSPWLLMGIHKVRQYALGLPDDPRQLMERVLRELPIPREEWTEYAAAVLMSINGWASWCAYERWQAKFDQREDDHILQLLAIRLAWEHFVSLHLIGPKGMDAVRSSWARVREWRKAAASQPALDWVFQQAMEVRYQTELVASLRRAVLPVTRDVAVPAVQAVFCIDVRSEVFRRALEAASERVETIGFAGFFGLPIAFTPLGTGVERPQLPGLLAPKLRAHESTGSVEHDRRMSTRTRQRLGLKAIWKDFRSSATSAFTFVESCGFFYAGALLKRSLMRWSDAHGTAAGGGMRLRPCLAPEGENGGVASERVCDLVAGILRNMSLTGGFARLVLLAGHGSETVNNPHAAGLDCGACGGQTGEVNARILAGLLNDAEIRSGLERRGIHIPETTYALAALHNTTTDEVTIFDEDLVPESHADDLKQLQDWLRTAGNTARMERAQSLGIELDGVDSATALLKRFQNRSRDWSQVRPEWGLANNAAFLIAPRRRSRGLNLQGRVFLHEYESDQDVDGKVLEGIMTAPMLVTNWINMQYYASTVDNRLYGSGNKVLHNVVGGRLGVFEGNGGDLRIGLPLQSLQDGRELRHTPLRLTVVIEAPQSSIDAVLGKHQVVRDLVQNGWIHLLQIVPGTGSVSRWREERWERVVQEAEGELVQVS